MNNNGVSKVGRWREKKTIMRWVERNNAWRNRKEKGEK